MKLPRYSLISLILINIICMLYAGCGYQFRADGNPVGLDIKSIAIPIILSTSSERDFEADFTRTIREEFISHAGIPIVDEDRADVILSCRVYEIKSEPLTYDSVRQNINGRVYTHETTGSRRMMIQMEAKLVERVSGKIIWHETAMKEEVSYNVSDDPLIARHNQQKAVSKISGLFAERIYMMTMERF